MNKSVPSEWKVLCHCSQTRCLVILSISALYTVLPDVNYGNILEDSYCTEMQEATLLMYAIYPFQKYKFTHYCTWDIDYRRPIFSCTLQPASAIVRPWLTTWSSIDALISSEMRLCSWPLLRLPLFCLCTLPSWILTLLLPLVCWPWWFFGWSFTVRICNSCVVLCLYMLSNWRFMRCTFELFQRTGIKMVDLYSLHWWKSRFTCTIHGKFTNV